MAFSGGTARPAPLVCAILLGLLAAAQPPLAAAGDTEVLTGPALSSFTQSAGKRGSTLKWLPHRSGEGGTSGSAAGERVARTPTPAQPKTTAQSGSSAMGDPFEDNRPGLLPNALVQGEPVPADRPTREPKSGIPRSGLPTVEPPKVPYVGPSGVGPTPDRSLKPTPADDTGRVRFETKCPSPDDPLFFKPIHKITTSLAPEVEGLDFNKRPDKMGYDCAVSREQFDPHGVRPWATTTFTWKASGLCHKPLYFEEVHLERYGHTLGPILQPVVSAGHFFVTVPCLPYGMGLTPPFECMYTLGYYRPGSCAPYMIDPLPLSVRAAAAEAGVVTGLIYLIP